MRFINWTSKASDGEGCWEAHDSRGGSTRNGNGGVAISMDSLIIWMTLVNGETMRYIEVNALESN